MNAPGTDRSAPPRPRIAVALSGGGHRAALFGLGALLYLVDSGAHQGVTSIASVSGGSLTNAVVGQALRFDQTSRDEFEVGVARPLAGRIARRGTLFGTPATWLYLLALLALAALVVLGVCLAPIAWYARVALLLVGLAAWGWAFAARGRVAAAAFRKTLFSAAGRPTLLREMHDGVDHVLCATELRASEHLYFARDFVYGFEIGHGVAGDLSLARAVQASAAYPGGFPPARLDARQHGFTGAPHGRRPRRLVLADGGVYDNMGDQWARGFEKRLRHWPELGQGRAAPDRLIVVNASARVPWKPFRGGLIPLAGEVLSLLRVLNVMYVNTTNVRRQDMVRERRTGAGSPAELPAVLVQIAQSPFRVAEAFSHGDDPVAHRARDVLDALESDSRDGWDAIASANAAVPTTLSALGPEVSARLLYQGYVVAMCNLHVLAGDEAFPLLKVPGLDRFRALVG